MIARSQNFVRHLSAPKPDMVTAMTLAVGELVVVQPDAGPRLAGKRGVVLGIGATRTRVRIRLDGSRGPITLHARFLQQA